MTTQYDAIIIGTGQAGPSLAGRFHSAGKKVAIIERHLVGGSCVNVGCIPTKALVASARAAHMARRASDFGVQLDGAVKVDMAQVHARMKRISNESNTGVTQWLEGMEHVDLIRGHARFVDATTVDVEGRQLSAKQIFINVGGRASAPPIPGLDSVDYLTSSGMMELTELPEHLVIVGGSYIGLEFAQAFRRFGSQVTVVERGPRLISRDDPDVSESVREILEDEGIHIWTDSDNIRVSSQDGKIRLQADRQGATCEVLGSHLLVATGRKPNTDSLDFEKAGIDADKRGFIQVDDALRTNVEGIWAIGDCNGRGAFTHTSYNDYEIVAANLFDSDHRKVSDRISCYGLYVDPPLGRIGMTESQARESGRKVLIGKRPMSQVGRAKERSETKGFIKILVDADTKEILGANVLGIGGDEVVQALLVAMYAKAPYTVISRAVHIHPTVTELLPTVLQNLKPLED